MTLTEQQRDTIADFAHRARVFSEALEAGDYESAYRVATEGEGSR